MKLATHRNTTPYCGSVGPVAYDNGTAWSVNLINGSVSDWRYDLKYSTKGCAECEKHIAAAAKENG